MHAAYLALLVVAFLAVEYRVALLGRRLALPLLVCAAAVFLNWAANTAYVLGTGNTDPELFFLLTDALSAFVVVRFGQGFATAAGQLLVSSYAGQIIMHLIHYGSNGEPLYYWKILTVLGYGQLGLLIGWALAHREPEHGAC